MRLLVHGLVLAAALAAGPPGGPEAADIVIRAAQVSQAGLHGDWTLASASSSSGGLKLLATAGEPDALDAPLPDPTSYFEVSFDAVPRVPYRVWLHLAEGDQAARGTSLWVQFSDALVSEVPAYAIGSRSGLLVALDACTTSLDAGWDWCGSSQRLAQQPIVTFREAGRHRLRVQVRDGSVQLDQIVLSPKSYLVAPPGAARADRTTVGGAGRLEDRCRDSR